MKFNSNHDKEENQGKKVKFEYLNCKSVKTRKSIVKYVLTKISNKYIFNVRLDNLQS